MKSQCSALVILILTAQLSQAETRVAVPAAQAQGFKPVRVASNSTSAAPVTVLLDEDDDDKPAPTPAKPAFVQPVQPKPAPAPVVPPPPPPQPAQVEPAKPSYPTCSSAEKDLRAMSSDLLGKDIISSRSQSKTWIEDIPLTGGQSRIRLFSDGERILVEMFNGSGQSVGITKINACADKGKISAHISLAGLDFGWLANGGVASKLLACTGQKSEIVFDIRKAAGNKIQIADSVGKCDHTINSTFSLMNNGTATR